MNINGYTLKAVKHFKGTDGHGFNANLYFNNKKIGEVTDAADGSGEINLFLDMNYRTQHETVNTDFLERLFLLHQQEQGFKDMLKAKECEALVCVTLSEPTAEGDYYVEYFGNKSLKKDVFSKWYETSGKGGKIENIDIFTSLDDFNIQDTAESEDMKPQEYGMSMT